MVRGFWPCVFYPLGLSVYLNLGFLHENAAQLEGELLHRKPPSRCQRPSVVPTRGHLRKSCVVLGLLKSCTKIYSGTLKPLQHQLQIVKGGIYPIWISDWKSTYLCYFLVLTGAYFF